MGKMLQATPRARVLPTEGFSPPQACHPDRGRQPERRDLLSVRSGMISGFRSDVRTATLSSRAQRGICSAELQLGCSAGLQAHAALISGSAVIPARKTATPWALPAAPVSRYNGSVAKTSPETRHAQLVARAEQWLRYRYGCGIVLSEQYCATGEVPDVIGWKASCQSVLVECKVSRSDFLADAGKACRLSSEEALGSKRLYLAPAGMIAPPELPKHWGLLECRGREVQLVVKPGRVDLRTPAGLMKEMNLLLASLRRVEVRIEPQTITEFLKWKNRMADYNGGRLPEGIAAREEEANSYVEPLALGS